MKENNFHSSSPPEMILSATMIMRLSIIQEDTAFDASSFSPPASLASSYGSDYVSQGGGSASSSCTYKSSRPVGGLSRSRCISSNLSALGGNASEASISRHKTNYAACTTGPIEGWGYFADTPRT